MSSILITGASRGIGFSTALVLGRAGHTVYATMRNTSRYPELAEIAGKESLPIIVSEIDVDSDESVSEGISNIQKKYGPIDVLINNAGIEERGTVEELDLAYYRAAMETNYFGPLRCIKAVLPQMRNRRDGCLINVTSVAGRISVSPMAPYTASKFALQSLSESLAQEAKVLNIRVAIVEPGIIDTAMARGIGEGYRESLYPNSRRLTGLFHASLQNPTSSMRVAEKLLDIIQGGT